jgi:hypothetical protein
MGIMTDERRIESRQDAKENRSGGRGEPRYDVLWPLSRRAAVSASAADRLPDLNGKTICELWDMNFRGETIYPLFREHIKSRFPDANIVDYSNFGNFHGPGAERVIAELPEQLRAHGCEAVIVGLGACGGCTPAVMRVAALIEKMGIPTVSVVTTGFLKQADIVARGLGLPLTIVEYPGHPTVDSVEELTSKVRSQTAPALVDAFLSKVDAASSVQAEPTPGTIVFSGTFDEVQDYFDSRLWGDGLPLVPPTQDRVNSFLAFTDRSPSEVLGTVPLDGREATIHSIAVTGVMAGCRPEYMPVLVATIEAMCDPKFRIGSCGTTPGWEPLVIVNGPIVEQLGFNSGQGVMRVGRRANTSIGRFVRLFLRNICGFRIPPGGGDKASIGQSTLVAIAENEASVREIHWPSYAEGRGFEAGESVVTVRSVVASTPGIYSSGERAIDHVREWTDVMTQAFASWAHMDLKHGVGHYLIVASPLVARVVAREWNKDQVTRYIHENAKVTAETAEHYAHAIGNKLFSLEEQVRKGILPPHYAVSADKQRLIDFFVSPESIEVLVAGDPDRNQSRAYMCNHDQGAPSSRRVQLPRDWTRLLTQFAA